MAKPLPGEYASYFEHYISLVETETVAEALQRYSVQIVEFFKNIPAEKAVYRYADGKWSLKELLQHIIDADRIFSYRALCIARKDQTPLPGFDENTYADNSDADNRTWNDLLEEFMVVRQGCNKLYESFNEQQLQQTGISNNHPISVQSIAFISIGHLLHHMKVIQERYL